MEKIRSIIWLLCKRIKRRFLNLLKTGCHGLTRQPLTVFPILRLCCAKRHRGRKRSPIRGSRSVHGVSLGKQDMELAGIKGRRRCILRWPPGKPPFAKSLENKPEPIAIKDKNFNCAARTVCKDEDWAVERVFIQGLAAKSGKADNAPAKICWFDGQPQAMVGGDLQHAFTTLRSLLPERTSLDDLTRKLWRLFHQDVWLQGFLAHETERFVAPGEKGLNAGMIKEEEGLQWNLFLNLVGNALVFLPEGVIRRKPPNHPVWCNLTNKTAAFRGMFLNIILGRNFLTYCFVLIKNRWSSRCQWAP